MDKKVLILMICIGFMLFLIPNIYANDFTENITFAPQIGWGADAPIIGCYRFNVSKDLNITYLRPGSAGVQRVQMYYDANHTLIAEAAVATGNWAFLGNNTYYQNMNYSMCEYANGGIGLDLLTPIVYPIHNSTIGVSYTQLTYYQGAWGTLATHGPAIWEVQISDFSFPNISPNIKIINPINGMINNSNNVVIQYNVSWSNNNISYCTLYSNQTGTWKANNTYINSSTITNNTIVNLNWTSMSDGNFTFGIGCGNYTGSNSSSATISFSTNQTFVMDTANPTLSAYNFTNHSIWYRSGDFNITGQFNFSDNSILYSYNISIDNSMIDGKTDLGVSFYPYNLSYYIGNLTVGTHNLSVRFADAHTANTLYSDYIVSKCMLGDCLKYNFEKPYTKGQIKIQQKENNIFDKWNTYKNKDRYTIEFEPFTKKSSYTFVIESDSFIDIINAPDTPYKQWLIYNEHWVDFSPYTDLKITRIKDNKVEVTINNVDNKLSKISFNSIGDLNIINTVFTFDVLNVTASYNSIVMELIEQNIGLYINKTSNVNYTNASLNWNGTWFNSTKTNYSNYDFYLATFTTPNVNVSLYNTSFTWYFNITGNTGLGFYNSSFIYNQTVDQIYVDNCSTYNTQAINISCYTESTNPYSYYNTTIKAYMELWYTESYKQLFNLTFSGHYGYAMCIYPNNASYNMYTQMEYSAQGYNDGNTYNKETYYLYNATFSNVTQYISLYNSPNATYVQFSVTDQYDEPVMGAYIHVLKYDLGTNSYITTEILKTDEEGEAIGSIILTTSWYKFFIYYEDELMLSTEPTKIITTTRSFRVNTASDYYENWDIINNVVTSLSYTNATRKFSFTFSNPIGTSVTACVNVTRRTPLRDIPINRSCLVASSGTILVGIPDTDGKYIASASIAFNPTFWWIFEVDFDRGYAEYGEDTVFLLALLKIPILMIGIWNPIIALILLVLFDFFMNILGLMHMNIAAIIMYLVIISLAIWRINNR